jgi:hypothetical protein
MGYAEIFKKVFKRIAKPTDAIDFIEEMDVTPDSKKKIKQP